MFPDMSNIYSPIKGFRKIKVHTLGPSRFFKGIKGVEVISEFTGLVSPVWHYIGVKVFCKTI